MELMVYIAILGIIVIVAGQAFSGSTKMRVRTQSMLKANEEAESVGSLLKEDLEQIGAKSSKEESATSGDDVFSAVVTDVYMDPDASADNKRDSSSFKIEKSDDGTSDFTFRKIHFKEDGTYLSVEEVRWFVSDGNLKRSCWTVKKKAGYALSEDDPCVKEKADEAESVIVAENVTAFTVLAGKPSVKEEDTQLFPRSGDEFMFLPRFGEPHYNLLTVTNYGTYSVLTGFATNFNLTTNESNTISESSEMERNQVFAAEYESGVTPGVMTWKSYCAKEGNKFTFYPKEIYEIYFELPKPTVIDKMSMFKPEQDFLSVGFRTVNGGASSILNDFNFYPSVKLAGGAESRSLRFDVQDTLKDMCLAMTFASYSPVAPEGSLTVENLKVRKIATGNYSFDESWNTEEIANIKEKKNVKALRVSLTVRKNGEAGQVEQVVLLPSNGPRD